MIILVAQEPHAKSPAAFLRQSERITVMLILLTFAISCKHSSSKHYTLDEYQNSNGNVLHSKIVSDSFIVIDERKNNIGSIYTFLRNGDLDNYIFMTSAKTFRFYQTYGKKNETQGIPIYYEFEEKMNEGVFLNIYFLSTMKRFSNISLTRDGKKQILHVEKLDSFYSNTYMSHIYLKNYNYQDITNAKFLLECNVFDESTLKNETINDTIVCIRN
jgi:hypothetical protein